MPDRNLRLTAILGVTFLTAACGVLDGLERPRGEVYSQAGLSRSYSYLVLENPGDEVVIDTYVGGEHINVQKIWAFRGQGYQVSLAAADEGVSLSVQCEDESVVEKEGADLPLFNIAIEGEDALIETSQYAHPVGDYRLVIRRIK
jgi:hypothetical protein